MAGANTVSLFHSPSADQRFSPDTCAGIRAMTHSAQTGLRISAQHEGVLIAAPELPPGLPEYIDEQYRIYPCRAGHSSREFSSLLRAG